MRLPDMYFLSKVYRSIKFSAASLGLIGSLLAIIYGSIVTGGGVFIIGGSLCLANSIFNLIETGKIINDIKKQVQSMKDNLDLFSQENDELQKNITELHGFVKENKSLHKTIEESIERIETLEKLRKEYRDANDYLKRNLKDHESQVFDLENTNEDLKTRLEELNTLKNQLHDENDYLQRLLYQANEQVTEIEKLKNQFEKENKNLTENVIKQTEIINESKRLIQTLAQFGDKYNEFSTTIDTNLIKLDSTQVDLDDTATVLKNLVERLSHQTFEDLDQNQDGKITEEEFQAGLQELQ